MINDEGGKVLHDRASRGERLSEAEHRQLKEWYAYQDRLELEAIQLPNDNIAISGLQVQIGEALNNLTKITMRIKKVAAENEQLRQENTILLTKVN